ncbi:hypothetical protein EDB84DRAFT_1680311 [Lactarius hengduanensis]|nr:hypothetical protein EDB84DRAFT_1680311 [Lactarius hengduanensis]
MVVHVIDAAVTTSPSQHHPAVVVGVTTTGRSFRIAPQGATTRSTHRLHTACTVQSPAAAASALQRQSLLQPCGRANAPAGAWQMDCRSLQLHRTEEAVTKVVMVTGVYIYIDAWRRSGTQSEDLVFLAGPSKRLSTVAWGIDEVKVARQSCKNKRCRGKEYVASSPSLASSQNETGLGVWGVVEESSTNHVTIRTAPEATTPRKGEDDGLRQAPSLVPSCSPSPRCCGTYDDDDATAARDPDRDGPDSAAYCPVGNLIQFVHVEDYFNEPFFQRLTLGRRPPPVTCDFGRFGSNDEENTGNDDGPSGNYHDYDDNWRRFDHEQLSDHNANIEHLEQTMTKTLTALTFSRTIDSLPPLTLCIRQLEQHEENSKLLREHDDFLPLPLSHGG